MVFIIKVTTRTLFHYPLVRGRLSLIQLNSNNKILKTLNCAYNYDQIQDFGIWETVSELGHYQYHTGILPAMQNVY